MSNNLDLNRLRDTVLANQNKSVTKPANPNDKVYITNDGKIVTSNMPSANRSLSEVPQETFADSRLQEEQQFVQNYMPSNTKKTTSEEGIDGWVYSFICELGQRYTMFAYYDSQYYQVLVLEPEVEDYWKDPHTGHIFSDGKICFGNSYNGGRKSLADAYSKSVLWATGLSVAIESGHFPFSNNQ